DPDLSKRHVEIRRTWDGVRAVDLDSKNGTKLDARPLRDAELRDGMVLELGQLALRYHDPAERHLGEPVATPLAEPTRTVPAGRGNLIFVVAIVVALAALGGLIAVVLR
ncbi:MAG: FHA domain-containing protein, partial [Kofleriaceae bacterium]